MCDGVGMVTLARRFATDARNLKSPVTIGSRRRTRLVATGAGDGVAKPLIVAERQARGAEIETLDRREETARPAAAAKLAVGHDRQADRLLHRDRVADGAVLDLTQRVEGSLPASQSRHACISSGGRRRLPT